MSGQDSEIREAREDQCPSCERFIGPADACPYCGSDARRRVSLRFLRYLAVAVGIGGTAILLLAARCSQTPRVPLAQLTPSMNFGYVRVEGALVGAPYVSRKPPPYVAFTLQGGTGEQVRVILRGRAASSFAASGNVPMRGDRVEVAGSVSASATGAPQIYVHDPSGIRRLDPVRRARGRYASGQPRNSPAVAAGAETSAHDGD